MFFLGFTGQGSQRAMMGKDFFDNFSQSRNVMEIAEDSLEQKISETIFDSDATELNKTINTQPSIMINALMIYQALISELPELRGKISCMAGHSVGEYNALCVNGVFDIEAGIKLLRKRAIFMENACPDGSGGMVALIGVTNEKVEELIKNDKLKGLVCEIANDNGGEQIVVSGEISAIDIMCSLAKQYGIRTIKLKVSGPFHSSLMCEASEKMRIELDKYTFKTRDLMTRVISNVEAKPFPNDENRIKELMVRQIISRVEWRKTVLNAYHQDGIRDFIEIGSSPVITNLLKKTLPEDVRLNCISSVEEMKVFLENYRVLV